MVADEGDDRGDRDEQVVAVPKRHPKGKHTIETPPSNHR